MRALFVSLLLMLSAVCLRAEPVAPIYRCRLEGVLTMHSADFLDRAIGEAAFARAQAVVITLDTPGGLLSATKKMIQGILNSPIPVIVHVSPPGASATSAGTFLTVAAHVAVMATGTNIGAAHPVMAIPIPAKEGEEPGKDTMMEKVLNDTVAHIKSVAGVHGRNVEWLEKAVRESVSITSQEALEKDVIDLIANDMDELLAAVDGREVTLTGGGKATLRTKGAAVVDVEMTAREKFYNTVADPNIAYLLLMLGLLAIVFEVTHPGIGLPGVAGVLSLGGALIGLKALPLSYTGLMLLLFGIAFLVLEVKTGAGGVLGLGGVASLALGSYLLFDAPPAMRVAPEYIFAVVGTAAFLFLVLMAQVVADFRRPPVSGREGMLGSVGVSREDFIDEGTVAIEGEVWRAVNKRESKINRGDRVRILAIRDGALDVERESS